MSKEKKIVYSNIKIRKEFQDEIKKVIENNPHLNYRSITDFVIDATRRRIEEIKK